MDVDYLGSAVFNRIRLRRAAIRRRRDKAGEERFVCWQNNVRQNDLGMELPGKDECIVDERKVVDYLLNVSRMPAAAKAHFSFRVALRLKHGGNRRRHLNRTPNQMRC
jgi:hypothetical protein